MGLRGPLRPVRRAPAAPAGAMLPDPFARRAADPLGPPRADASGDEVPAPLRTFPIHF